ncbi:MAG TPA: glycosyltransferase family 2 protein, partial [Desulfobulbus sp.]|nr:glycosyltransferase family 2 protein [Desulfobulbus sp.]
MKNQRISVIIPTWNRVGFLEKAIGSVLAQTRPCDELIVVDDGSSDGTADLVRTMASIAGREINYIFQENRGAAAARNRGIAAASGELLCFLDSDDWWDPA